LEIYKEVPNCDHLEERRHSCPGRGAAQSDATQSRDPSWLQSQYGDKPGPGTQIGAPFFVYILASKRNGTLYIAVTNNPARRMSEHKAKLVPGFTRKYDVDQPFYIEAFDSIPEARAREHALKR
jgi:putative endonuclease